MSDVDEPASPAPGGSGGSTPPGPPGRARGYAVLAAGGIALGMHLVVGAAYTLTLLLAPAWVSVVLALWWLVLLLAGLVMLARRSVGVLAVPLVAIVSWAAAISAGRAWLGWG